MEVNRKRCKVIMLPTDKAENSILMSYGNIKHEPSYMTQEYLKHIETESYHLYITSDDEIKVGDWVVEEPQQKGYEKIVAKLLHEDEIASDIQRKIIATTDSSLGSWQEIVDERNDRRMFINLPQPSKAFIEKYCELGGIDEVDVEHYKSIKGIQYIGDSRYKNEYIYLPTVDPIHNTITIHRIKDSWSREEVNELCELYEAILHGDFHVMSEEDMYKRINQLKP